MKDNDDEKQTTKARRTVFDCAQSKRDQDTVSISYGEHS
jgi:hypothetical protein